MKGFMTLLGYVTVALIVVGVIVSLNAPQKQKARKKGATTQKGNNDTQREEVAEEQETLEMYVTSAAAICAKYDENSIAADEAFKGKWSLVVGQIASIGKDIMGSPYVELDRKGVTGLQCIFSNASETSKIAKFRTKQTVAIAGVCAGSMLGQIIFRECQVVNLGSAKQGDKVPVELARP